MRLVLASFFQPEFHGPGRKIGVAPTKPNNVDDCDLVFAPLSPDADEYYAYHDTKKLDPKQAGEKFVGAYKQRLDEFKRGVKEAAIEQDKPVEELLPFKEGDTLLSWEHRGHLSYRSLLAECLRDLGYEVIEN